VAAENGFSPGCSHQPGLKATYRYNNSACIKSPPPPLPVQATKQDNSFSPSSESRRYAASCPMFVAACHCPLIYADAPFVRGRGYVVRIHHCHVEERGGLCRRTLSVEEREEEARRRSSLRGGRGEGGAAPLPAVIPCVAAGHPSVRAQQTALSLYGNIGLFRNS
jgi:hypothetical protein